VSRQQRAAVLRARQALHPGLEQISDHAQQSDTRNEQGATPAVPPAPLRNEVVDRSIIHCHSHGSARDALPCLGRTDARRETAPAPGLSSEVRATVRYPYDAQQGKKVRGLRL